MYRSQNSNLKRRIEALERSPSLQPLPEAPDCASMIQIVAALGLDSDKIRGIRSVFAAHKEGVQRIPDRQESEAWDAFRTALELETRRAAFTEFAEYERAYPELCLRRTPVTSTDSVECQVAFEIANYRRAHGEPMVPEGWEIPKGWWWQARGIWATKCKSLFCSRTPGGPDLRRLRKMRR
jgi:hypothetical protein